MEKRLPDTSEAEEWINPDTFVVNGKAYQVAPDGKVTEVEGKAEKEPKGGEAGTT